MTKIIDNSKLLNENDTPYHCDVCDIIVLEPERKEIDWTCNYPVCPNCNNEVEEMYQLNGQWVTDSMIRP